MITTVDEVRTQIQTTESDEVLEKKLKAIELKIRAYTNNNFQVRGYRHRADIVGGYFGIGTPCLFKVGDTVQVTDSQLNEGLYLVSEVENYTFEVSEPIIDESGVTVTKIVYPEDVVQGAIGMLKWDIESRDKVGVQSETISRHSVTYYNMDAGNSMIGYPASLVGFLKPYKKARF